MGSYLFFFSIYASISFICASTHLFQLFISSHSSTAYAVFDAVDAATAVTVDMTAVLPLMISIPLVLSPDILLAI